MISALFISVVVITSFGTGLAVGLFYKAENKKKTEDDNENV
jgi:hypothetical protein